MLTINVPFGPELWDEEKEEFTRESFELELEHSLVTLSKWESIHQKPFLGRDQKTPEEVESYIRIMIQTPQYPADLLYQLSEENVKAIQDYIQSDYTATTFRADRNPKKGEIITSELVYFWMNSLSIDKGYETWHLNKLFTLIKVHSVKNQPKKEKVTNDDLAERRRRNEQRKRELGTEG